MNLPVGDRTHKDFWQQLLRWVVADTPGPVVASVPSSVLYDDGRIQFSAEVRDKTYQPLPDAQVEAHGPGGRRCRSADAEPQRARRVSR